MATPLPGWSFMILGIAMMLYSRFIESRAEANLALFFWLGAAFIAFGFLREILSRRARKAEKEAVQPPKAQDPQQHPHAHPAMHQYGTSRHATHQHVRPAQHHSHPHEPSAKACPRCHQPNRLHVKHCHACGFQFY